MALTQNETLARVAAVIATLAETDGTPESTLYIFFDMDMDLWSRIRQVLIADDQIRISNHYVTLTEKGQETARKINAKIN